MSGSKHIALSYVMTTFNKVSFLRVTVPLLIEACGEDEEIIITDGGSTDGSIEYLTGLFSQGKIHKLVCEKDYGESHGTNKAILLAEGELVKLISDDDIFHFPTIAACKNYMLQNKDKDILGFDGYGYNANLNGGGFEMTNYVAGYRTWTSTRIPFLFCGLSYMIRRSSFAYMGLFNCEFKIVDIEYSLRVSSMKTNIAFYTGCGFVNIVTPHSNSHKFYHAIDQEKKRLMRMYPVFRSALNRRNTTQKLREFVARNVLRRGSNAQPEFDYEKIAMESNRLLNEYNMGRSFEFI